MGWIRHFMRHILRPDAAWVLAMNGRRAVGVAVIAAIGLAFYGFTVGYWRSPLMGCYVAIKMPLLIACTLVCNALLNGFLGMLLQTGLGFRQSLMALLWAFGVAALILGGLSPVTFFLAWNAPSPTVPDAATAHASYLLAHTLLIACAGVFSNLHLHRVLSQQSAQGNAATITLLSWLGGNAVLGAQFSFILRPFFGTPHLKVAFLREDPFAGTFYETVWFSMNKITSGHAAWVLSILALSSILILSKTLTSTKTQL